MKLVLSLAVFAVVTKIAHGAAGDGLYTYYEEGGLGPNRWQFLDLENNQCGGTGGASGYGQSPIKILSDYQNSCFQGYEAYEFNAGDCKWDQLDFTIGNNGVKVEPKANEDCSFGSMRMPGRQNVFNALQFHIHTSSEHEIENQGTKGFFPAELHVVHLEDGTAVNEDVSSYAVFGTMLETGVDDHEVFEHFLKGWEAAAQKVDDTCAASRKLRARGLAESSIVQEKVQCLEIGELNHSTTVEFDSDAPNVYELPNKEFGTYTYKGGLTTPGCNEIVNWNLVDKHMTISQGQLDRLEHLILCYVDQDTCQHATVADRSGSTSRPPQPVKGRNVQHRCFPEEGKNYYPASVQRGERPTKGLPEYVAPERETEPDNTKKSAKCGSGMWEDCNSDPRYNTNASPNLKANSEIWYDFEGYWVGTMRTLDETGELLGPQFYTDDSPFAIPYPKDDIAMFVNITVKETRYYESIIYVYKPADAQFCSYNVENTKNSLEGECGVNGYVEHAERFGTATYEKDGKVNIISTNGRFRNFLDASVTPFEESFFATVETERYEFTETATLSNEARTEIRGVGQFLVKSNEIGQAFTYNLGKASKDTFNKRLEDAYDDREVLSDILRKTGDCLDTSNCPTEKDFRKYDPIYNASPYTDDEDIKGGYIAMFVILGSLLLVGVLFYFHIQAVRKQSDRYKHQFARRVAETIDVNGTHEKLDAAALEAEFERMDTDRSGSISKEEMQAFMGDKLSHKDFNALFAAMDVDHNNTIDFAEFCAFMSHIGEVYDEETKEVVPEHAAS
mmetsp:Transcript_23679/g.36571  ORF Transcript_23679/g.36571 Transcript_23679/m.36571 type:complete len:789 (-) Transcript_23679:232-2598(-)|eukprot:CAMPEP_0195292936 /NCGR_PEP_ID=MMETSP0707-20130614/11244_1 /TAXON_ID=33640 /ORGANISM="Asterionellopsis glacialis, Strain CCMP134" /LENGTH=788 /DNA_ID=CAMNT_0040353533 /DNA_START=253 /DNA_END=2619 /DNA_ORIENTATION=-